MSLPLQMAERLLRAQPVSVANHVKARRSLIERSVTWLATESSWARRKRYAICSGKLCGGFIIFEQCCPCVFNSRVDDVDDVILQGHVMQQQSRRRLPSLHAIGRSRCVDLDDTPSEPAWLPLSPSSDHEVDKVDEDEEEGFIPATRYASQDYK